MGIDLDEMMSKVYIPNSTRERRVARALAEYTDIKQQYGDSSVEEEKVYAVMVELFPEMKQLREGIRYLAAASARGELQSLLGDEVIEAALQKSGLSEE